MTRTPAGSGHGTDYRFGENVSFRVMVEHDGRCTSSAPCQHEVAETAAS